MGIGTRRAFMAGIGAVLATSRRASAQQAGKVYRIGHISLMSPDGMAPYLDSLTTGLRELGYLEGKNFVFEHRSANDDPKRLPDAATQLVKAKVDVIVTGINTGVDAARHATTTIPIVMVYGIDPVGMGFIASLNRPGGNITGGTYEAGPEIFAKKVQLLKEIIPKLARVAVLWNEDFRAASTYLNVIRDTAREMGVVVHPLAVRSPSELERAFASMDRVDAVIVVLDPVLFPARTQIAQLAAKQRVPIASSWAEFAEAGALICYGLNAIERWRRAAVYIDKVLKGTKPSELPVEQPSTFRLVINLRTARALGLTIPRPLLLRADTIIE